MNVLTTGRVELAPFRQTPLTERPRVDGKYFARGVERLHIQGVTYGPFAPDGFGHQFPALPVVRRDFGLMREAGVNAIRTYHVPPNWFLSTADECSIAVLVDVPWPKHLSFLDSEETQREARRLVRSAAEAGRDHPSIFAYSIGNEIPASIVRWHGAKRVEKFIGELADVSKQADANGLVTYANYPSTEYLNLPFLDFATFNVYLHDPEAFRRYLMRLHNLVGERPLLLGEIGMDTMRHGEEEQAHFLAGHLAEASLTGVAGAFVFSWTDDWYTGGYQIEDWAFGITDAERHPKASYHEVGRVFKNSPSELLKTTPRVSVVVCSYNGGTTLRQCLESLLAIDYPDYEVILVDDGSTDETKEIAARFPSVRTIHGPNRGLSAARNIGLEAATGSIVAYTDSDCFADPHWLTQLVYQLERTGADGVGGPNLTPDDGPLAACVAASPGQPTHVLEDDQTAEHVPGCNMAFRRDALLAVNGFNPRYRKAGDDVDLCWRLQDAGMWITFAPGAFVWHHRRQNPRTYLKQQAGYGEAEGLLWFRHPEKFNGRGEGKWRGSMYGGSLPGLLLGKAEIYRGTFGSGLFQTLYQPGPAHWASIPSTLEWHVLAGMTALLGVIVPGALLAAGFMLLASLTVAALRAVQAPLPKEQGGLQQRGIVAALSYVQPLVRSWWRYRTRFFPPIKTKRGGELDAMIGQPLALNGSLVVDYWDEQWRERTDLLDRVVAYLEDQRWAAEVDSGWSDWDLEIYCHPWTAVQVTTTQEDHGSGKRLIRVRYRLRPTHYAKAVMLAGGCCAALSTLAHSWVGLAFGLLTVLVCAGILLNGRRRASAVTALVDVLTSQMGFTRVGRAGKDDEVKVVVKSQDERRVA
jgi:O-antigen biosynthesis protein